MNRTYNSIFIFLLILSLNAELIIYNYGDNNKGSAGNNTINGTDNTWIGAQNNIKGKQNAVIGN
jgi:hypothetical protein